MALKPITIKLPEEVIARLSLLGHTKSIETGARHTPSSIIRRMVEQSLHNNGDVVMPGRNR